MADYGYTEEMVEGIEYPSVTICVTAFNHERFIKATLLSILSQNYPGELRIKVGIEPEENTDLTVEIVESIASQYNNIEVVRLPKDSKHLYNYGVKTGRANFLNTFNGVETDLVAHLDGDDQYVHCEKLKFQAIPLMLEQGAVATSSNLLTNKFSREKINGPQITRKITVEDLAKGQYFHLSTVLYKNIFKGKFPFDFFLPHTGDYYLSMMYAKEGHIIHVPIVGSRYNAHDNGIYSSVNRDALELRMRRNLKKYATDDQFSASAKAIFTNRYRNMQASPARLRRAFLLRPTVARAALIFYVLLKKKLDRFRRK